MWLDIYVLVTRREMGVCEAFVSKYLSEFEEAAEDYLYPRYSDNPELVTSDVWDLVEVLCLNTKSEYGIYWTAEESEDIFAGMIFFTNDGCLILGLTVAEERADDYLNRLKRDFDCEYSISLFEALPPLNSKEFIEFATARGTGER